MEEIVVPHDDEKEHEDCNERYQDHVADCWVVFEARVLHHPLHKRKQDGVEDDDVGEVAEDVCGDPDFEVLEGVDFLAVEEALSYDR